jgi:hypothetical protein
VQPGRAEHHSDDPSDGGVIRSILAISSGRLEITDGGQTATSAPFFVGFSGTAPASISERQLLRYTVRGKPELSAETR